MGQRLTHTHTQNEQPNLHSVVMKPQRQPVTSKQIGRLQRSTRESTVEKPVKKMEHCENGSAPCHASHFTAMKHIMDETKTFKDLNAV